MEDILNILEKITKIRATGTFAGYEPEGRHKNAIYFATDKDEIYFNGKCYSGSSKNEDIANLLEDYVKTSDLEIVEIPSSVYDFNDIIGNRTESTTITQTQFDNIWNYILKAYKINGLIKIKLIDAASIYPYYIFKLEHIMDSPYKQAVFSSYIIKGAGSYDNGSTLNKNYLINHVLEFRSNTDDNSYILFRNLLKQTTGTSTTDVMSQKACTDSFVQKEVGKVLSSNDFTNEHKDKLDNLPSNENLNTKLNNKVDKEEGKGLSTNDYDATAKEIVDTMPEVVSELSRIIGLQKKMNRITGTTKYDITDTNFEYYVKNVGMVNTIIVVKNKTFELNLNKNIITSFSETFRERTFIDVLDLSQVNTSQLVNVKYMFSWCNINFLNICNFNLNNLDELNITNMFYRSVIKHIKCNQYFKDWCYNYKDDIMLPSSMLEGGETIWEIID